MEPDAKGSSLGARSADGQRSSAIALWLAAALLVAAAIGADLVWTLWTDAPLTLGLGVYQLGAVGLAAVLVLMARDIRSPLAGEAPTVRGRFAALVEVAPIALQLGLLVLVFRGFSLESPAFHQVLGPLILLGFVLHELTPPRHRTAGFLALSLAAIYLILGAADGLWLVGLGTLLVLACHAPIPMRARIALVITMGAGLAALRAGAARVPWSGAIWPILGSIFMFRLAVYLYDLKHGKVAEGWAHRLAYFFLLPNVAFTLFPVVDYGAYRRGYYDTDRKLIYQRGIDWMARGTIQLLLYRLVYQEFTLAAASVATWDQLARHLLSTFLLYLRVSGQFHLIVGILHLFGFHLPETHKGYYMASSFTDLWRRINIYWKDFMMKVVYYPTYFGLRRRGETTAIVTATLLVFFTTWLLHSYQWFWLLGTFPLTATDSLFWGILAGLLVVNVLREASKGRARSLGTRKRGIGEVVGRAARVCITFSAMTALWSLWMSPTVADWLALWRGVEGFSPSIGDRAIPLVLISGMCAYGIGAAAVARWRGSSPLRARVTTTVAIALLLGGSVAPLGWLPESGARVARAVRTGELNAADLTLLTRGYYEDLTDVGRFNSQLWEVYLRRPANREWPVLANTPAGRLTGDFLRHEMTASASMLYHGERFTTNRWGMRDQEYDSIPAEGVTRVAVLGASIEMGWGVADGETFEAVLEERLNEGSPTPKVEVLNFAVEDYSPPQQLMILDRVFAMRPQVLLLATHEVDASETVIRLIERTRAGVAVPFEGLRRITDEAGLGVDPIEEVRTRLTSHVGEIESWAYGELARRSQEEGVLAIWVHVPVAYSSTTQAETEARRRRAADAGLETISLEDAFAGWDVTALQVRETNIHPNALGHRLLAEELEGMLRPYLETFGARGAAGL